MACQTRRYNRRKKTDWLSRLLTEVKSASTAWLSLLGEVSRLPRENKKLNHACKTLSFQGHCGEEIVSQRHFLRFFFSLTEHMPWRLEDEVRYLAITVNPEYFVRTKFWYARDLRQIERMKFSFSCWPLRFLISFERFVCILFFVWYTNYILDLQY